MSCLFLHFPYAWLTVCLQGLFVPFNVMDVEELTLGANKDLSEASRLPWNVIDHGRTKTSKWTIQLKEIKITEKKSFLCTITPANTTHSANISLLLGRWWVNINPCSSGVDFRIA